MRTLICAAFSILLAFACLAEDHCPWLLKMRSELLTAQKSNKKGERRAVFVEILEKVGLSKDTIREAIEDFDDDPEESVAFLIHALDKGIRVAKCEQKG